MTDQDLFNKAAATNGSNTFEGDDPETGMKVFAGSNPETALLKHAKENGGSTTRRPAPPRSDDSLFKRADGGGCRLDMRTVSPSRT